MTEMQILKKRLQTSEIVRKALGKQIKEFIKEIKELKKNEK